MRTPLSATSLHYAQIRFADEDSATRRNDPGELTIKLIRPMGGNPPKVRPHGPDPRSTLERDVYSKSGLVRNHWIVAVLHWPALYDSTNHILHEKCAADMEDVQRSVCTSRQFLWKIFVNSRIAQDCARADDSHRTPQDVRGQDSTPNQGHCTAIKSAATVAKRICGSGSKILRPKFTTPAARTLCGSSICRRPRSGTLLPASAARRAVEGPASSCSTYCGSRL